MLKGPGYAVRDARDRRKAFDPRAENADRTGVRTDETRYRVEQGGLAGAVWPDQAVDRAGVHLDGHVIDRNEGIVTLAYALGFNGRRRAATGGRGYCFC